MGTWLGSAGRLPLAVTARPLRVKPPPLAPARSLQCSVALQGHLACQARSCCDAEACRQDHVATCTTFSCMWLARGQMKQLALACATSRAPERDTAKAMHEQSSTSLAWTAASAWSGTHCTSLASRQCHCVRHLRHMQGVDIHAYHRSGTHEACGTHRAYACFRGVGKSGGVTVPPPSSLASL